MFVPCHIRSARAELDRHVPAWLALPGGLLPQVIWTDLIERYAADDRGWQLSGPVCTWPADDLEAAGHTSAAGSPAHLTSQGEYTGSEAVSARTAAFIDPGLNSPRSVGP